MIKILTKSLLLLLIGAMAYCHAAQVTLVEKGKGKAVILLDKKATKSAQMGAFELQHHIKLITGATLPITNIAPKDKIVIKIGGENSDIKEEAIRIRFSKNKILLTGGDTLDYGKVDYKKAGTFPPVNYHWKGSLFAVYDFLEDYCDVHFYGIAKNDTTFKKNSTLRVIAKNRDFVPGMDGFRDFYDDYFHTGHLQKFTVRDQYLWKLRWRSSVTYAKVNHNTYSIYFAHWGKAKDKHLDKAFKYIDHDMFAKGYEGKGASVGPFMEKRYPGDLNLPPQLCYSHPKTIDYYAKEGLIYYHGKSVLGGWMNNAGTSSPERNLMPKFPGKPYFYPYEGNDSSDFCKCDKCQKLATSDTFSQTKFLFLNKLVEKAEQLDPKAKIGFATLAYGETLEFPTGLKLHDRSSVELCLVNYAWWHPIVYKKNLDNYKKWVNALKGKAPLTLWLYVYGPQHDAGVHYGKYKPFPLFYPWQMAKQMQQFNQDGIKGVFAECKMPVNYLEAYIVSKLSYNPKIDAKKLIDKFFTDYYGAAGKYISQIYSIVEKTVFNPNFTPKEWTKNPNIVGGPKGMSVSPWWPTRLWSRELNFKLGSHERIKQIQKLLDLAKQQVKTPEEKERLNRFIALAWKPAVEGRREHDLYLKQKEVPPRHISLNEITTNANGNPLKVDWNKVKSTQKWLSPNGVDINSTVDFKVAADSKYVYFRFFENRKPLLTEGLWTENVEFFFTNGKNYPYYHLAHGPKVNSKPTGLIIQNINDSIRENDYDFQANTVSIPTNKDWTLYMAIPRNRLPFVNNVLSCDFFRMRHDGKNWHVSCWQPTYTVSGNKGMDSYGKLYITPFAIEDSAFKYLWKGQATFQVKDDAAQDKMAGCQLAKHPWYLSYHFPKGFPQDKFNLTVRARIEAKNADTITFGVHQGKKRILGKTLDVKKLKINGKNYVDINLGTASFVPGMYYYTGGIYVNKKPNKNPDEKIFVDKLIFNKAE